ncbi:MAG: M61 family metallopeptidase [Jaaginema sp. PMC 1079.18]|nr:M61 family metallopeptidase [Jaaginema sp. PMC 1080.18]MEC4850785.1 M61 family metallopeptidase [Jaaginema sp. PMC 1079.18]MEC4865943.1 M61 family metallopeptidase [Jaaginema sp. PMC 1078.18]
MTQSTVSSRDRQTRIPAPFLRYTVAMPRPETHFFEVTLAIEAWRSPQLDLKMPVWTPGSYLVREYAKQVQELKAVASNSGQSLTNRKVAKNHWQIDTASCENVTVTYRVFANELTVRTNHLDGTHGYFNGAALFFFIPGYEQEPIEVAIALPDPHWQITTPLPTVAGEKKVFVAPDFDTLVDSPFEIGIQETYDFEALGKHHQWVIWGKGNIEPQHIIDDTIKIIEVEAQIYGNLPYEKYIFLLHLSASGYGGLEHKNACSLNYFRLGFRNKERYNRFMQLVAHEFFHLWNVKRIRPHALEKFNYEGESYTTSLWFCEGTTSYYDALIPCWANIYNRQSFFEAISKDISRFLLTPGRKVQPVSEASFDAWIKLYRRDANSDNSQISYYLKGAMVSLLLDLKIRTLHQNARSLNDILRKMWQQFGQDEIGFTEDQLRKIIESVAGCDLSDFFAKYVDGTEELPFDEYLQPFGLQIKAVKNKENLPYTGIKLSANTSSAKVQFVEVNSPANLAGIDPGDELLAIDNFRVTADKFNERLQDYQPGDEITLTVFHQDELQHYPLILGEAQPIAYKLATMKSLSKAQKSLLDGWLQF